MEYPYDKERAKAVLKQHYEIDREDNNITNVSSIKEEETHVRKIKYPPGVRLMQGHGEEEVEVICSMYGAVCGYNLPPLRCKPARTGVSHLRSMRQHVKITAFDLEEFHRDILCLERVGERINAALGGDGLSPMEHVPHEGFQSIDTHARYFTDRAQVLYEIDTPFSRLVDPQGILAEIKPHYFIHGADNWVEYCKETKEGKHEPIDPSTIKNGDLVEVAFACVAVPTKEGKHKMMLNLKAVTVIDDKIRKEADQKRADTKKANELRANFGMKRRRIYVDMDDPREPAATTNQSNVGTDASDNRRPAKHSKVTETNEQDGEAEGRYGRTEDKLPSCDKASIDDVNEETERMQED